MVRPIARSGPRASWLGRSGVPILRQRLCHLRTGSTPTRERFSAFGQLARQGQHVLGDGGVGGSWGGLFGSDSCGLVYNKAARKRQSGRPLQRAKPAKITQRIGAVASSVRGGKAKQRGKCRVWSGAARQNGQSARPLPRPAKRIKGCARLLSSEPDHGPFAIHEKLVFGVAHGQAPRSNRGRMGSRQ